MKPWFALFLSLAATASHAADAIVVAPKAAMPALTHPWSAAEFQAAIDMIVSGQAPEPFYTIESGKATLNHITSAANFASLQDASVPLTRRIHDAGVFNKETAMLLNRYIASANRGDKVHAELAAIAALLLNTEAMADGLVDQGRRGAKNPSDAKLTALAQSCGAGAERSFVDVLGLTGAPGLLTPAEKSTLLAAIATNLAPVNALMTPVVRNDLKANLEARRKSTTDAADLKRLDQAIQQLAG
jgi:hypothetical protein